MVREWTYRWQVRGTWGTRKTGADRTVFSVLGRICTVVIAQSVPQLWKGGQVSGLCTSLSVRLDLRLALMIPQRFDQVTSVPGSWSPAVPFKADH